MKWNNQGNAIKIDEKNQQTVLLNKVSEWGEEKDKINREQPRPKWRDILEEKKRKKKPLINR